MKYRDSHPSWEMLAAFDQGTLAISDHHEVETHVAGCAECCRQLERVPADPLLSLMRTACGELQPSAPASVPPELVNHPRYLVKEALGAGGMGTVFLAEHRLMARPVALKVIQAHLLNRPGAVERFRQEAKAAARLSHPNIVTAFDADQAGEVHFLVMEYVPGRALDRVVHEDGPRPVAQACDWARQVALGLQHANERGMVHRDIKPGNLLLTPDGTVKILDFGLSLLATADAPPSVTPADVILGTPDYMAPEQALNPHAADIRADIYSLGCTLYFLLAGHVPFPTGTALQKVLAHQDRQVKPLRELRPDLPAGLDKLVAKLLAKDPAQRLQTPAEVASALAPFADSASVGSATAETRCLAPPKSRRRLLAVGLGFAVLAIAVSGIAYWFIAGRDGRRDPPDGKPLGGKETAAKEIARFGGNIGPLNRVTFSPDCRRALVATTAGVIHLWELDDFKDVARFEGHVGDVMALALSADGKQALTGGQDGLVLLWDLDKPAPRKKLEGHKSWVRGVAFHPDGRHAVSAGNDALVILWDLQEGSAEQVIPCHEKPISSVAVTPDGKTSVTTSRDRSIGFIDLKKQAKPFLFFAHDDAVTCAAISADGQSVLSGSADRTAGVWHVPDGKELQRLPRHPAGLNCIALSRDGKLALAGCDKSVHLWDITSARELFVYEGHEDLVLAVAFCGDGRRIASGCRDGTIRFWSLPKAR